MMGRIFIFIFCIFILVTGCDSTETNPAKQQSKEKSEFQSQSQSKTIADVNTQRLVAADKEPQNWLSHGRTYSEQRFSPLKQINDKNVDQLGLAWSLDLSASRGLEATPLVVDGIMYDTGTFNIIRAIDAKTGKELWHYDPKVPGDWLRYVCCGPVNRGVAVWHGKLYEGLLDGRLIAVDAATGKLAWEVQTTDRNQPYSITGAPRVVNGKVIIGNGGAEFGVRGYVTAYDAETGEQVWRFYTVPGNPAEGFESPAMEMAARTWSGEWWKLGGGGTAWDSFSFDPGLNLLYIGTGNAGPWPPDIRSPGGGDNLFVSSIVAVNADTGEYVWHYQTTPRDRWDYTAAQQMILADLKIKGETRKVIMQAPKNGFFYVLDRATGELLSAKNFSPVNWASHVDMKTGRPVLIEENLYGEEGKLIIPGPQGAHDWHSMSYSPLTGLVYIPEHEMWWVYSTDPNFKHKEWAWNIGANPNATVPGAQEKITDVKGSLLAWDPVAQKKRWQVPLPEPWNGGVVSTAGNLVVQGAADGRFVIYSADKGEKLWEMDIHTGAVAAPITYMVDGEQYIAINAGWGGALVQIGGTISAIHHTPGRVLAFKLGGKATLPEVSSSVKLPEPPALTASQEMIDKGRSLYGGNCANCHGFDAVSGGAMPDLRYMSAESHTLFNDIVLKGVLVSGGMANFSDALNETDAEAIHAYLISRAHEAWEAQETGN